MQEGESELGGLKIPHGNTTPPSSTPGPQPAASATEKSGADPSVASNSQPITPIPSVSATTTASTVSIASVNQSAPTSPTPVVQPTTQSTSQSTQVNQTIQRPQFTTPVSSRPLSTEVSQQASTVQSGGIERNIQGFASLRPTSETPPADSFAQQFISSATDSAVNDVILTTTKSKRWKKWVIGVIVGAGVILSIIGITTGVILGNSSGEEEYYQEIDTSIGINSNGTYDFYSFIKNGLDSKISFFRLFILGYIKNHSNINIVFSNGALVGKSMMTPPSLLQNNFSEVEGLSDYDYYLSSMQELNLPGNVKELAKNVQALLPEYTEVSQTFLTKMRSLRQAFYDGTAQDLNDFATNQGFSNDITSTLLKYKEQYDEIVSTWDICEENLSDSGCVLLDTEVLNVMESDTSTVSYIFNNFIRENDWQFLKNFELMNSELTNAVGDLYYDF